MDDIIAFLVGEGGTIALLIIIVGVLWAAYSQAQKGEIENLREQNRRLTEINKNNSEAIGSLSEIIKEGMKSPKNRLPKPKDDERD